MAGFYMYPELTSKRSVLRELPPRRYLLLLEAFEYPHPDQGRRPNPLLPGDRAQSAQGFWIKANGDSGGEPLGNANADGFELVLVVSGAMGIPEGGFFLNTGKFRDTAGCWGFLLGHRYVLPRCCCS